MTALTTEARVAYQYARRRQADTKYYFRNAVHISSLPLIKYIIENIQRRPT